MLESRELLQLTRWCKARQLHWQPAQTESRQPAILLQSHASRLAWDAMLLVEDDEGFALLDCAGEVLATTSDLPALLDALDAGLGKLRAAMSRPVAYAWRGSTNFWNLPGSAIT